MRLYPAIELNVPPGAVSDVLDRVLAIVDDFAPLGVEEIFDGARIVFSSTAHRDSAASQLRAALPGLACRAVDVSDEDWAARSQANLGAIVVGRFVVAPPWDTTPGGGVERLIIQPSMGFGTGHHASTRLCLELLLAIADLHGRSVIDVGTGSGVLAIAAARLGAGRVLAIDSDADALHSARENLQLNDLEARVELRCAQLGDRGEWAASAEPPPFASDERFDVVLANLTGALLMRQAQALATLVRPGGRLILSGIEMHEADDVLAAFGRLGGAVLERRDQEGWTGITLTPSPTSSRAR